MPSCYATLSLTSASCPPRTYAPALTPTPTLTLTLTLSLTLTLTLSLTLALTPKARKDGNTAMAGTAAPLPLELTPRCQARKAWGLG